eukprot:c8725_g1_i2.p1 GENE.c8725_g1_i2~~c8725_g1_i2.p1  ORF type:complete len:142 (-),score=11.64 c8725_g1_i2:123-548(-)
MFVISSNLGTERDDDEYGMPSDHTQFMLFLVVYICMCIFCRGMFVSRFRGVACGLMIVSAGLVAFSRIYLGYHTQAQVIVGSIVGAALAVIWYFVTWLWLKPQIFPIILRWRISQLLFVRDNSDKCCILESEYPRPEKKKM